MIVTIQPSPVKKLSALSPRQQQILQLICEGLSSKQMADRLGLSIKTIEMHRSRLHDRLGTRNVQQVIRQVTRWTEESRIGSGEKNHCARLFEHPLNTRWATAQ